MMAERFSALQAVAGPVSRETFDGLVAFEGEFRKWSARINLTAPSTLPHLWERHILDSAQLIRIAPAARRWLDLGSGGGFPGAVIAILMKEHAPAQVDLVESNRKKAAFLQTSLASLKAPCMIHPQRIEDCYGQIPPPEVITARALAPLPVLFGLAEPWMKAGARALLHKGRDYRREIEESRDAWGFNLLEHGNEVGGDGVILEISDLRRL
ncbi:MULTISPECIES: 16S rRNA (guanine(527)-N(7))-methyltransferase RsmG [Chelativorans]|jgi:16S rRNA (guanine527-N7)-methyltransferase|uniref:Ribosomal RNA small subunit methyltransferase G n=1 Tax=Chelativorans sp. (strain BNC1) TaxID=266779 RepID=RSMG_CHESB|nr:MULTISPECIES: 16S rRNA (guanine(527)-N(7))-methyltransferase RsmG [Chelativorans]Q11CN4.1 RecName: Full=Ribosomal RNA small subunit methyltransferase G; AltName: Full=16S rRNA 7-methylguanosine methyltransferase; Short=16S rRNA m7G methyltransferase [Chelativorans sp. BNC1]